MYTLIENCCQGAYPRQLQPKHRGCHHHIIGLALQAPQAAAAFNARVIPNVAYTGSEVAWVGLTEDFGVAPKASRSRRARSPELHPATTSLQIAKERRSRVSCLRQIHERMRRAGDEYDGGELVVFECLAAVALRGGVTKPSVTR